MIYRAICTTCGHCGMPYERVPGSAGIEAVLWLMFIVPGLIYSLWRRSAIREVCEGCGRDTVISRDAPVGRDLVTKRGGWKDEDERRFSIAAAKASRGGISYVILFGLAALVLGSAGGSSTGPAVVAGVLFVLFLARWILREKTAKGYLKGVAR